MRFFTGGLGFTPSVLLLFCFTENVVSRPSPQPKASWVRQGRAKKTLLKSFKRWTNETTSPPTPIPTTACTDSNATTITAPKDNVWGGLTGIEAASVTKWLLGQSELNLTNSEDAGDWDNSMLVYPYSLVDIC